MDTAPRIVFILAFWAALPTRGLEADGSAWTPALSAMPPGVSIAVPLTPPTSLGAGLELATQRLGDGGGISSLPGGLVLGGHLGGGSWGPSVGGSSWVDSGTWAGIGNLVFSDGFERGDTSAWGAP